MKRLKPATVTRLRDLESQLVPTPLEHGYLTLPEVRHRAGILCAMNQLLLGHSDDDARWLLDGIGVLYYLQAGVYRYWGCWHEGESAKAPVPYDWERRGVYPQMANDTELSFDGHRALWRPRYKPADVDGLLANREALDAERIELWYEDHEDPLLSCSVTVHGSRSDPDIPQLDEPFRSAPGLQAALAAGADFVKVCWGNGRYGVKGERERGVEIEAILDRLLFGIGD